MRRMNFFVEEKIFQFLKALPGTMSEHLRVALKEYVDKRSVTASASSSKRKEIE